MSTIPYLTGFFQDFFSGGKSIVMLIFLLFSDQILGGGYFRGPPVEESQLDSNFSTGKYSKVDKSQITSVHFNL